MSDPERFDTSLIPYGLLREDWEDPKIAAKMMEIWMTHEG